MIQGNLLKFSFVWNFHNKKCVGFSLTSFDTLKNDCVIKTIEMLIFLSLINSSVTTGFSFLLLIMSTNTSSKTINNLCFFQDCILQYFHKYLAYHFNIL